LCSHDRVSVRFQWMNTRFWAYPDLGGA
jgi:hypothetical protein